MQRATVKDREEGESLLLEPAIPGYASFASQEAYQIGGCAVTMRRDCKRES